MTLNCDYTLNKFISMLDNKSRVLDVGCGEEQYHANLMIRNRPDCQIETNDICGSPNWKCSFLVIPKNQEYSYDAIWCSHFLEHQENVGITLEKMFYLLKPNGLLSITVPDKHDSLLGGHLTIWTLGLLYYNLIVAGFDCSAAIHAQYDKNISIILRKKVAIHNPLVYDNGDIETLKYMFPFQVCQGANGTLIKNTF